MYTPKAELKAGLLVVAAASALLFFIYKAAGSRLPWASKGPLIHLRFEQGFTAPNAGGPVLMNGLKIGRVDRIGQKEEVRGAPGKDRKTIPLTDKDRARLKLRPGQDGVFREVYVSAVIELLEPVQPIPKGTRGEIKETITGDKQLSLLPGPSTENLRPEDTEKDPILTTVAGDVAELMKHVDDVLTQIGTLRDNANELITDIRGVVSDVKMKVAAIDVTGIQGNILEASKDLRSALSTVKLRVDEIGQRLAEASASVKSLTDDAKQGVKDVVGDLREALASLKSASKEIDAAVARNSPKIDAIFDDVRAAAESAKGLAAQFDGVGASVKGVVAEAGSEINAFLKHISEMGHNLADMTEDLRAHPWKLANKPEDKEIALENVRNALSNSVRTSGTINETLRRIKEVQARTDLAGPDRDALLKRLYEALRGDLARYEAATQFLLEQLQAQTPR